MARARGQALLETAVFVGLMLMVLMAALNYRRNLYEQRMLDENVFSKAKNEAYNYKFTYKDTEGDTQEAKGATISHNENWDRQSKRLFQPQRRSSSAGYTVYWSSAEDPPDKTYQFFNTNLHKPDSITIEFQRNYGDAFGNSTEELKMSTWDWIVLASLPAYALVDAFMKNIVKGSVHEWWGNWGGWIGLIIRTASFGYFLGKYLIAMQQLDDVEANRKRLEKEDKQMGEWGWRVASVEKDGEGKAGKFYMKEVTAQTWDTLTTENKNYAYNETQSASGGQSTSTRSIALGDNVLHRIQQRYDVTKPNPTIPLPGHSFQMAAGAAFPVALGGSQSETWTAGN